MITYATCVPVGYLTDDTTECIYVFLCGQRRGNTIPATEHRPHTAHIRCRRWAGRTRLGCLVWQLTEFSLNHEQVISDPHMMIWWWAFRAVIFRCRKYWQRIKYQCTLILCCYISTWEGQNYFRRYRYGVLFFFFLVNKPNVGCCSNFKSLFFLFWSPLLALCVTGARMGVTLTDAIVHCNVITRLCPRNPEPPQGLVDCCSVNNKVPTRRLTEQQKPLWTSLASGLLTGMSKWLSFFFFIWLYLKVS